jgi:aminopeptidase N
VPFTRQKDTVTLRFDTPAPVGKRMDIVVRYACEYPKADGTGLTWTAAKPDASNLTDKAAQIHSQGEPQTNHQWYICHDFPNERLTTELLVTVEDPYVVGSNGHLVETSYAGAIDGKPRTTWHWLQDKPHCNYLVSMVVGRFAIVGLPYESEAKTPRNAKGEPLPVYLYAPLGTEKTAQKAYAKTPAMVAFFSRKYDEPYAWDKYAQALVRHFAWGGMENTSITTMQSSSAKARAGSQDEVISHELCHQWTGDLMTTKGWEHLWLNEGWASFGEALWAEEDAPDAARKKRAYQRVMNGFISVQRGMNRTTAPEFAPLVSNRYLDPQQTFFKPNDVYSKGACVLHMLRQQLGDDAFFKGVHLYMERCKFTCVETDDFRRALEEVSGRNLERFFTQWCYRPGLPRLEVTVNWVESSSGGGDVRITAKQTQKVDGANPAYAVALPVQLKFGDGDPRTVTLNIDQKETEASFHFDAKPSDAVVDPDRTILAASTIHKSLAMWFKQVDHESVFAQAEAVEHLATCDDPAAAVALARVALDPEREDTVRTAAAAGVLTRAERMLAAAFSPPPPPVRPTLARGENGGAR